MSDRHVFRSLHSPRSSHLPFRRSHLILLFSLCLISASLTFMQLYFKKSHNSMKAAIIYDQSLTEIEKSKLEQAVNLAHSSNAYRPSHSITFSATTTLIATESDHSVTSDIWLPTVDFYSDQLNLTINESQTDNIKWVSLNNLTPKTRVVSIDGNYYFDDFKAGAKYRQISAISDDPATATEAKQHILLKAFEDFSASHQVDTILSFAQTGVTALTRNLTNTLSGAAAGRGSYFADRIKDFLSKKDLTHLSNEVSFADNCQGSRNTMSLCADWRTLDTITAVGTDIIELTGNHNNNYGTKNNLRTIQKYHELGIKTVGGGENEATAAEPLTIKQKQTNLTLLAYNHSTSTKANGELANGNQPGANGFTVEKAKADIKHAKDRGDFVIVDVQFSECYSYPDGYTEMPACDKPIKGQTEFFRQLIDFGADLVVGTQAHHPQTFEYYLEKPIYYGLGNLFFDQTYWPGTRRGLILTHYFKSGKLLNTRISPTWYDGTHQVFLMPEKEAESFLGRLVTAR